MPYIGNSPANIGNYQIVDDISASFNGVLTTFALTAATQTINPAKSGQLLVSINGVLQEPDDTGTEGFLVSGSNIVFSSAPATGSTFWCVFQGQNVDIGIPSNDTVGITQLSATGTPNTSTFLRGDNTWVIPTDTDTTTTLSVAANILTYTDEDGLATNIDLSLYLDDTNAAYIASGSLNGSTGVATFTRSDATSFDVNMSAFLDDTTVTVNNTLTSTSTTEALSAAQGKALNTRVLLNDAKVSNVAHPLVETAVPVGALFTDTNTTYSVGDGGLTQVNFTTADNTKLDGIATSANNYTHPATHPASMLTGALPAIDGSALTGIDAVVVGTTLPSPVSPEGSLFYKSDNDIFYISNGTQWNLVSNANPATTGGTVTIGALSEGGTFSYNLGIDFTDDVDTDAQLTYTLVLGTMPTGCVLPSLGNSALTGTAGNVSSNTNYTWTIKATDTSGGTATQNYQQTINTVAATTTGGTVTISAVNEGSSASYDVDTNFTFTAGSTFSAYSLASGTLPSGLSLNTSTGVISGTMGQVASTTAYSFTIRATDTDGDTADQAYSWSIVIVPRGTTSGSPASTPADVRADNSSASNGMYWYTDGTNTYQAYTKFDWHESSHWILVLKVHARGDMPSGSSYWTNSTTNNDTDSNITGGSWAKYKSWNYYSFNRVLLDMNGTVPCIMVYTTSRTMYNAMQNNSSAAFGGLGCNSTNPTYTGIQYIDSGFIYSGSSFSLQTGHERHIQKYGINCFANTSTNSTTDNASLSSVGRAGARVGAAMDEGGYTFGASNASNGGSDSGFGFGGCAGNAPRTWSCGYGEWNTSAVVNTLPGRLWVR
jgi:hypothetical protein